MAINNNKEPNQYDLNHNIELSNNHLETKDNQESSNQNKKRKRNFYDRANLISKLYCLYAFKFLWKHYRKDFDFESFDECSHRDECKLLGDRLQKRWHRELKKGLKKASLTRALFFTFGWTICLNSTLNFIMYGLFRMISPILLGRFIHYANLYRERRFLGENDNSSITNSILPTDEDESNNLRWLDYWVISTTNHLDNALFYAGMLSVVLMMNFLMSHPHFMENFRLGMHFRVALTKLVFEKALRISNTAIQRMTIGKIVNLISTDASRFDVCFTAFYFSYCAVLHSIVAMVFLYLYIGNASIGALIIIFFYIPLQALMAWILSKFRSKSILLTDDRLRLMAEILPAMRVIKMYCWERPFAALVHLARRFEISKIRQSMILRSINLAIFFVANKLIAFCCIIWYLYNDQKLTAEMVFVSLSLIYQIRESMTFFFPMAISYAVESYISLRRIEKFLLEEEQINNDHHLDNNHKQMKLILNSKVQSEKPLISLKSVKVQSEIDGSNILNDVSFEATQGQLTVIIGQVGSGKSSVLLSILDELKIQSGIIKKNGKINYASQEAWIFTGTVRQNILFGREFDSKRYWKVVKVAALEPDLEQMPYGDQTQVDDRGTSLSGGQRARISLARALYADADCYLLDDPLSAVDAAVAKHIFEKCIKKYLKDKIVILVTHQLQFIKQADQIIVLKNGFCLASGSYQALLNKGIDLFKYTATEPTSEQIMEPSTEQHLQLSQKNSSSVGPTHQYLVRLSSFNSELFRSRTSSMISTASTKEDTNIRDYGGTQIITNDDHQQAYQQIESGDTSDSIKLNPYKIYWLYTRMGAGFLLLTTCILSNILTQILYTGSDYWLSAWTDYQENLDIQSLNPNHTFQKNPIIHVNLKENIIIYSCLVGSLFVLAIIRTSSFFIICMRSSVNLHNKIFSSLIQAPIVFFDKTPIGIIMNRVSRDLSIIDDLLPVVAFEVVEILGNSFAVFILCGILNYFILIPSTIMAVMLYLIMKFYVNTARNIRRLEAVARSPLFNQMASILAGLPTIRSYNAEEMFIKKFTEIQNVHSSVLFTFLSSSRLFGISLEFLCLVYIYCLILFLSLNLEYYSGSLIGLLISQSLSLTSNFNWGVRQLTELETFMTSVERIIEFGKLEKENFNEGLMELNDGWPPRGQITFEDVCLQYNPLDEPVLKNLTFTIAGGEKIGIVGRTGAGKSSIITALFRLIQPTGLIYIDGINTANINLTLLRKKLSIIPQEPILFSGDIRRNLDPFNENSDEELWDVIEKVQLKSKIVSLDTTVSECGNDFSVGQKQLICLARAILRKNRILILDEATANVDPRTDSLIQETIRTEFEHCTVLTIAHRLNTIIDYDRVLVLDHGRLMQLDTPYQLIIQESGIFYELYNNLNADMKSELKKIAKRSLDRQNNSIESQFSMDNNIEYIN